MSYLAKNYNRKKISFKFGKGSYLFSSDNKKYLDFVQGIAVNSLGHSHPKLVKTIKNQSRKLWHVSNAFQIPEGEKLAKKLCNKTFADFVMFQNSGTEATEAAVKVARRYFYSIGKPNKNRILCVKNSFHGRTLAAIFASGSKKMTEGFGPKIPGFDHFRFGNHDSLKKKINKNTAAIMVETVMGEGGIKVIPDWCLRELRQLCNKKKILLILDEVQCGVARSGDFFAFEKSKVKPDIVPIAKGIGGGFPIGAVLMNKKVASGMTAGSHGSTFGGTPIACAVAHEVLNIVSDEKFLNDVSEKEKLFLNLLSELKAEGVFSDVRSAGLWIGCDLVDKSANEVLDQAYEQGLILVSAGSNCLRLAPALNIPNSEIEKGVEILKQVLLG